MVVTPAPPPRADARGAASDVRLAAALLATCALLTALGFAFNKAGLPSFFDLDDEGTLPSLWSGGLLAAAAAGAWRARAVIGRAALGLAVLLAFMAVDEVVGVHEALERAVGVDWQVLYLPIIAAGGVGWLLVLRGLRTVPLAAALWVLGAGAWFVAQLLELWEWDGTVKRTNYYPKMYAEESLEMVGSALWVVALIVLLRTVRTAGSSPR